MTSLKALRDVLIAVLPVRPTWPTIVQFVEIL